MAEIRLYKSNSKGFKLIALTLPFVIIGLWMVSKEQPETSDYIMGWFCISFFGLGIPIGLYNLLDNRAQIIIDESGVWDKTLKQGKIKWEQILETYPVYVSNQKFISIVVDDKTFEFKKRQARWMGKFNQLIGVQALNLNLSQIEIDEVQLSELLNKIIKGEKGERMNHIRAFGSAQKLKISSFSQKIIICSLILILLAFLSLRSEMAFFSIMVLTGLSAVITRWYSSFDKKPLVYEYTKIMTYLGFINLVVLLLIQEGYKLFH